MRVLPTTMKAWQISHYAKSPTAVIDALVLNDSVPLPEISDDQVLIQNAFCSVNPIDWRLTTGEFHDGVPVANFPLIPGFDVAGTVVKVGKNVADDSTKEIQVGDRVICDIGLLETCQDPAPASGAAGGFAEYSAAFASTVVKTKEELLDLKEVVGLPLCGLTAYQGLFTGAASQDLGKVEANSKVLILGGAGGVGCLAIQMAKARGARVVTTASPSKLSDGSSMTKVEFCQSLGAASVIDYTKTDWSEELAGQEFDIVYDCVGLQEDFEKASKVLKKGGLFATIANFNTDNKSTENVRYAVYFVHSNAKDLQIIHDMVKEGEVKVPIDSVYQFADTPAALMRSLTGRSVGKIVIEL